MALFVLASLVLFCPGAQAWSNGGYSADQNNPDIGTHDWIAKRAVDIQTRDTTFLKTTHHSRYLLGTEAPDNPEFIGDTANHHVYFTSGHMLEDDASALRAASFYTAALASIRSGRSDLAAYDLGIMTHYISDVGVFGHTMGAHTDWGAETHHSDYESEFEARIDALPAPAGMTLGNADAYNATLDLAEDITFGAGAIRPNTWMDSNYNWADETFFASAMASLNRSVAAVASVINHFMMEAAVPIVTFPQPPASMSSEVQGGSVTLSWASPADNGGAEITAYVIFRGDSAAGGANVATVPGSARSWTDNNTRRGETYFYWVVAENSAGQSEMSPVVTVSIPPRTNSYVLPIVISVCSVALASIGTVLVRRRRRR